MAAYYGKTAKMWVKELCEQQGGKVEYCTLPQNPEISHRPNFLTSCTVTYADDELMAPGQGSKKIEAEQMAATTMLFESMGFTTTKLCALKENRSIPRLEAFINADKNGNNDSLLVPLIGNGKASPHLAISDTDDAEIEGTNPIGALQEACAKRKIPPPEYEELEKQGPSHQPAFTLKCSVGKVSKTAKRGNKKKAKAIAAFRVLRDLNSMNMDGQVIVGSGSSYKCIPDADEITQRELSDDGAGSNETKNEVDDVLIPLLNQFSLSGNATFTTQTGFITNFKDVIVQFLNTLDKQEQCLDRLSSSTNPLLFLHNVCQQSGITLTLYDLLILPASVGKYYHAVLKIKYPFPGYSPAFSVVEGKGNTESLAVRQCAVEALKLIQAQFLR